MRGWSFKFHFEIKLPSGVDINSLLDVLINISWEATEILFNFDQIIKASMNKINLPKNNNMLSPVKDSLESICLEI